MSIKKPRFKIDSVKNKYNITKNTMVQRYLYVFKLIDEITKNKGTENINATLLNVWEK